jgi:hypothetical protein
VLIAAAVLVMAAFAPGIAGAIADAVKAALCRISGAGCSPGEGAAPDNPWLPDEPCVRSQALAAKPDRPRERGHRLALSG